MTIALVGEILQQKNQGLWYLQVKSQYTDLFPYLPELTRTTGTSYGRFYRIQRNFERIYPTGIPFSHADLALLIAQHHGSYLIDSKPLPVCKGIRYQRTRAMSEASSGRGGASKYF